MIRALLIFLLFLTTNNFSFGAHAYKESYYQHKWCSQWGGTAEYKLKDGTRIDCLTSTYAVEFDFGPKWAEAIGQSLYYADLTGRKPAVILILENSNDIEKYKRLKRICQKYGITTWYMLSPAYKRTK